MSYPGDRRNCLRVPLKPREWEFLVRLKEDFLENSRRVVCPAVPGMVTSNKLGGFIRVLRHVASIVFVI